MRFRSAHEGGRVIGRSGAEAPRKRVVCDRWLQQWSPVGRTTSFSDNAPPPPVSLWESSACSGKPFDIHRKSKTISTAPAVLLSKARTCSALSQRSLQLNMEMCVLNQSNWFSITCSKSAHAAFCDGVAILIAFIINIHLCFS
jgi:hypothetical protein